MPVSREGRWASETWTLPSCLPWGGPWLGFIIPMQAVTAAKAESRAHAWRQPGFTGLLGSGFPLLRLGFQGISSLSPAPSEGPPELEDEFFLPSGLP